MDAAGPLAFVILGAVIGWVVMLVVEYLVLKPHWIAQGRAMVDSEADAEIRESLAGIERMHQEQLATLAEISNQLTANRLAIEAIESPDFDSSSLQKTLDDIAAKLEALAVQRAALAESVSDAVQEQISEAAAAPDDLTLIKGIGPSYANRLNAAGVHSFDQLAALTPEELNALLRMDGNLTGRWIQQARVIVSGRNKLKELS
ncbi:MAG: hypothetical protein JXB47_11585 [Anaerolineae bacterium]|nr:hypothetical protein [Anaerolineae bacterium]